MFLPKSYCREYADIDPTCQIDGFQLCKIDWANSANRLSKITLTEFNSLGKFFTMDLDLLKRKYYGPRHTFHKVVVGFVNHFW